MDYMKRRRYVPIGQSDPQRVTFHTEPEERGFYHDDDGEPHEYWIEGSEELNFEP